MKPVSGLKHSLLFSKCRSLILVNVIVNPQHLDCGFIYGDNLIEGELEVVSDLSEEIYNVRITDSFTGTIAGLQFNVKLPLM